MRQREIDQVSHALQVHLAVGVLAEKIEAGIHAYREIRRLFVKHPVLGHEQYEATLGDGRLPIAKGFVVDDDDHIRGAVIQELMCYDGLRFESFEDAYDIDFRDYFSAELERLEPMAADGLVEQDDESIAVTPRGRLLIRSVAMAFDRYLNETAPERFSKAI